MSEDINGKTIRNTSPDANETDSCLEKSSEKQKTNPVASVVALRDRFSEKTGLSNKAVHVLLVLLLILLILLITIIILGALWPQVSHQQQFPVCKDSSCLRASAQVQEARNTSAKPCTDLWNYACGGWLKNNPLPPERSVWNQKQQLVRQEAERVRDLVATLKVPLHMGTVEWKLKHLYGACLDIDSVNIDGDRLLSSIISELGGWYITRDWNDADFEHFTVLRKLQVVYGVSPFFKISVEPDPHDSEKRIIRIGPSGLGLPDKAYYYGNERIQTAYKDFIRDIVIYLSSPQNEAAKFGTDIFSYEKRIAEITPDLNILQNPISTYNPISVSELKQTILIPFHDILSAMYPEASITENTEVIVSSLEYLNHISQIISTTDMKTMNGYLIWTLVRQYIPYMPVKYTSTLDTFNSELYGIQKPQERWEFCAHITQNFMDLATDVMIDKMDPVNPETNKTVSEIFNTIVTIVKNKITKFKNIPTLYNHLNYKLKSISLEIGLPNTAKDDAFLKNYYLQLKIMRAMFFDSVKNAIKFKKKLEENELVDPKREHILLHHALQAPPKVAYIPSENVVIVPRSLLSKPLFEYNYPKPIIYGRIGVEIAEAILESILPYGSMWTAEKQLLSQFHSTVSESYKSIMKVSQCLNKYILGLNVSVPVSTSNESALKIYRHILALSVANEVLLQAFDEDNHIHLPALEDLEDTGVFFLSYAQTQCTHSTSQQQLYENILKFELPQRTRLHLIWDQLPDFSKSLDCNFNSKDKCDSNF